LTRVGIASLEDKSIEEVLEFPVKRIHTHRDILRSILAVSDQSSLAYRHLYAAYEIIGELRTHLPKLHLVLHKIVKSLLDIVTQTAIGLLLKNLLRTWIGAVL